MSATTLEFAVESQGIKKSFNFRPILKGVNFKLGRGEHLTILGRNGCGKTTLLNILSTLIPPSSGQVFIEGLEVRKKALEVRRKIGVVAHATMLYHYLSVMENLRYYARMYGVPDPDTRIQGLIQELEIEKWQNQRVNELSRGIQQRAAIARALVHEPSLLLIDEPETGLDPSALNLLENILAEQRKKGRTIIATSHNLNFAGNISTRIAILDDGRLTDQPSGQRPDFPRSNQAI